LCHIEDSFQKSTAFDCEEAQRPKGRGLPGELVSVYIVPLDPALNGWACGAIPVNLYAELLDVQSLLQMKKRKCIRVR
jgi:hypothetical protein